MLDGITGRVERARRAAARATALPLLVRAGIGLAFILALVVAWPAALTSSRYVLLLFLAGSYPAVAPRGRGVTFTVLLVVGGWVLDTTWYDSRVALWRVLSIATLIYLGHTLAALAAVLPSDAIVNVDVVGGWLGRALLVVLISAVLTVVTLGLTAELAGGAFVIATLAGLGAAVGVTLLLGRLLRRP
ncbi:hypothetical protein DMB66_40785 [Actinoplanes sp. ATCC 53533]|uniref:hypothetical protein n=1 Tax=Actinoplanes sp. ATCC 53533 TaxID=1288362 RepID=UPI000F77518C|nr:hypothetical protein [Actinoplanes sp. ATCC 53533]RSM52092.1 hypothetical protein DMB66_40785 [Actinoplanes sp. ATCC 53533]